MSIISAMAAGVLAIMSALVIAIPTYRYTTITECEQRITVNTGQYYTICNDKRTHLDEKPESIVGIYTVLIITSLTMLVVTILTSPRICRVVCCCRCCRRSTSHAEGDLMTVESDMAYSKALSPMTLK